jgi:hypothetical protein
MLGMAVLIFRFTVIGREADDVSSETTPETTEITAKIKANNNGKITDDELVEYLTNGVKYKPGAFNPYEAGTPEWFQWSEGGKPYTPGSFEEVTRARDTHLLSPAVYKRVLAVFYARMPRD